jgi:hypothetical protein
MSICSSSALITIAIGPPSSARPQQAARRGARGQTTSVMLAEAVHPSTNAPVNYFDAPAQFPARPRRYWDGGIPGCNNPLQAAVTKALVLGQDPTDIAALSLGTATGPFPGRTGNRPTYRS